MPVLLSRNEIRSRALAFAKKWENECSEDAEAKSFWDDFFNVFGITRKRIATFEEPVKKLGEKLGFIDLFWKGKLIVEHKSRGRNLDKAYSQALDYFEGIKERDLPKYVLVSDFEKFRLYDLESRVEHDFFLKDLPKKIHLFNFISGYKTHVVEEQDPVNIKAAELMGRLHDSMKAVGYDGHPLEVFLVRLLFCMFAEDTGIFEIQQFRDFIDQRTHEDGSDLGGQLGVLFQVLNTPRDKRLRNLDEQLADFAYINGALFAEPLPLASFDTAMRNALLNCCSIDWSRISPAIFGSLFQSIMDKTARRNLGAHYTSESNILKVLRPLFLDDLRSEFERAKGNKKKLAEFHKKLRTLTFLDPACGCGNFLVIAYRELRLLELDVLQALHTGSQRQLHLDVRSLIQVDVDQFFGIEIEEFPAQIAQVALWLIDHQMNQLVSKKFGLYFARIPLHAKGTIHCANALTLDWSTVIPAASLNYIMGNPPFVGAKFLDANQKRDTAAVFQGIKNGGVLDLVAAWYILAASFISGTSIRCAFVSTNSITQGEQVGVLWSWMLDKDTKIFFAHRTFAWNNEASGKAAVHCVIIGFAQEDITPKTLFEYDDIKGDPHGIRASNINPYLVNAPNLLLTNRTRPLCTVPIMGIGNKPIDNGQYLFTHEEKEAFLAKEPQAAPYFRRWLGAIEFLNGYERWCLWLGDCPPHKLKCMPESLRRVEAVRQFRLASKSAPTRKIAATPTRFHVENMPDSNYLIVPKVSSERRLYVPIGFETPNTLVSDLVFILPSAALYHFGIISSIMHNSWMRSVAGRLESRYRYSLGIVYNNFPWPKSPNAKQIMAVESAAQGVLDARAEFYESSLANLYDPLTMPTALHKAHTKLDACVDKAYGRKFTSEAERVAFLFALYGEYVQAEKAVISKRQNVIT